MKNVNFTKATCFIYIRQNYTVDLLQNCAQTIQNNIQPLVGMRFHTRECRHPCERGDCFPSTAALLLRGDACAAGLTRREVNLNRILKFQQYRIRGKH